MNCSGMVQGHLSRFELYVQRTFFIDILYLLTSCEDVVFTKCVDMLLDIQQMATLNHPYTTIFASALGQCNPGCEAILWLEAHIGRVLVISHMVKTVGFFNKQNRIRQNNVGTDQTLNSVKYLFSVKVV